MWSVWSSILLQLLLNLSNFQSVPTLLNGSFEEGLAGCCQIPPYWMDCGSSEETPPDVHCHFCENPFGVMMPAPHGEQFLAMVVRSNGTRECIQQELSTQLQADSSYVLRFYLGRDDDYKSVDRISNEPSSYSELATLRIYWMTQTGFVEGIEEIIPFGGAGWTEYYVRLKPQKNIAGLLFEAGYSPRHQGPYNGHILIDHLRLEVEK